MKTYRVKVGYTTDKEVSTHTIVMFKLNSDNDKDIELRAIYETKKYFNLLGIEYKSIDDILNVEEVDTIIID